jgi:hypothetical protein
VGLQILLGDVDLGERAGMAHRVLLAIAARAFSMSSVSCFKRPSRIVERCGFVSAIGPMSC